MTRRRFLLAGAGAAGALVVGWGVLPPRSRLGSPALWPAVDGEVALNGWIKIARDGSVLLAMARAEMGQGVHGSLAMLVAEELEVDLPAVRLVQAGADAIYGNVAAMVDLVPMRPEAGEPGRKPVAVRLGQWVVAKVGRELGINTTGGSSAVADAWEPLRWAAATARAQLLGAASLAWKLPIDELRLAAGVVTHPSGQRAHFGTLAETAARTPPGEVMLKAPQAWRVIGQPARRPDVPGKTDGSAVFGLDVRLPGLLFADVRHAPALGGSPGRVDNLDEVLRRPGVERIVRLPGVAGSTGALAVVGRTTWHARQAAQALQVDWQAPPLADRSRADSQAVARHLEHEAREAARTGGGFAFHDQGDVAAALARAHRRVEAYYSAPYLAHATMEPLNCTARVAEGRVELWVGTQVPTAARAVAARVAGVPESAVTLHVTLLGGGFGRRLEVDVIAQAVRVAQECGGRPVQLAWSREEDFTHDFYRPAGGALLQAGLDEHGRLTALAITSAGDVPINRLIERTLPALAGPVELPDKTGSEGLWSLPYDVAHRRYAHVATRHAIPVGSWRSVGHSHNAFFAEAFIDELAQATGQDPVAYRLAMLQGLPRHAAVLRLAADKAGWGRPLPAGRARGVALHESFGSIVAQVLEVSIEAGAPRVHRVVCAVDCGIAVSPRGVAQQMESGVLFGLTAALHGGIDIEAGVVRQRNFPDQPLLPLARTPVIETHIVPSTRAPSGMGEPGTPPVAPALASALAVLTGQRWRSLPLRLQNT